MIKTANDVIVNVSLPHLNNIRMMYSLCMLSVFFNVLWPTIVDIIVGRKEKKGKDKSIRYGTPDMMKKVLHPDDDNASNVPAKVSQ